MDQNGFYDASTTAAGEGCGVEPVFYLSSDVMLLGRGTEGFPYIIS